MNIQGLQKLTLLDYPGRWRAQSLLRVAILDVRSAIMRRSFLGQDRQKSIRKKRFLHF